MKHQDKVKIARRLISKEEIRNKISLFQSKGWLLRADGIRKRIENNIKKVQKRKSKK